MLSCPCLAPLPVELSGNLLSATIAPLLVELSGNLLSAPTIAPMLDLSRSHLFLLGFFERHRLAHVAHALALVRLGRLVRADLGRHFPHPPAVASLAHRLRRSSRPH